MASSEAHEAASKSRSYFETTVLFVLLVFTVLYLLLIVQDAGQDYTKTLYIASQASGILRVQFDPTRETNTSLSIANQIHSGSRPAWLTTHTDKLYSISRSHFPDTTSSSGGVFAFQRNELALINAVSSQGQGGVHIDVSPDGTLLAAANTASSVSIHALNHDGSIGALFHLFRYSQPQAGPGVNMTESNAHQAVFDPSGRYLVVPGRGADRVYIYSVDPMLQITNITLPSGTGPRHAVLHETDRGLLIHLLGELDDSIRVIELDHERIQTHQVISTLGRGSRRTRSKSNDLAAGLAMSRDGKFLYASNRNLQSSDSDTIAVLAVDEDSKERRLRFPGLNKTRGKVPVHFALSNDPDNPWLAAVNQATQDVQMFERHLHTGALHERVGYPSLGVGFDLSLETGPSCLVWQ